MKQDNEKKKAAEPGKGIFGIQAVKISKKQKIWIGVAAIVLAAGVLIGTVYGLNRLFFGGNRHFTVFSVKIDSLGKNNGYWNDPQTIDIKSAELRKEMKIEPGEANLFALDLEKYRAELLKNHPEMEDIQLIPVLPDLLQIRIIEREPVARLAEEVKDNTLLIDKHRVVFAAKYCSKKDPPHIKDELINPDEKFYPGKQIESDGIKFLLAFINLAAGREFGFEVVSAKIINDTSSDNFGTCIKAHLKHGDFDCRNIFFQYERSMPYDVVIERLRESCRHLRNYAADPKGDKKLRVTEKGVTGDVKIPNRQ